MSYLLAPVEVRQYAGQRRGCRIDAETGSSVPGIPRIVDAMPPSSVELVTRTRRSARSAIGNQRYFVRLPTARGEQFTEHDGLEEGAWMG